MPSAPPFAQADLRAAIAQAMTWADTPLGNAVKGANYRTVQRWAKLWGIPTNHFDPNAARRTASMARVRPLDEALVENSSYARGQLKSDCLPRQSSSADVRCADRTSIGGRRMSRVLDHINGVSNDHRLENLRIVCPNCAATLDTHCGRKLPRQRTCPNCGEPFVPKHIRHRYCSQHFWRTVYSERLRGIPQPCRRKVPRPSLGQLMDDLRSMSFLAVGRKYGVSDNAVRKWIRWYERGSPGDGEAEAA